MSESTTTHDEEQKNANLLTEPGDEIRSVLFEASSLLQYVQETTTQSPKKTTGMAAQQQQQQQQQQRQLSGGSSPDNTQEEQEPQQQTTTKISSLNFERVVNGYSIQATLDSLFPEDDPQGEDHHPTTTTGAILISAVLPGGSSDKQPHQEQQTFLHRMKRKGWFQYTEQGGTRWFLSAMVGLAVGVLAVAIVAASQSIVEWRMNSLQVVLAAHTSHYHYYDDYATTNTIFVLFAGLNAVLATLACLLCLLVAPGGAGSGIPQIMAYLNGVRVHFDSNDADHFASFRLLAVKIVGTILSVSSFLAIGMEGPLIHIGAIVGCGVTKSFSVVLSQSEWLQKKTISRDSQYYNPTLARSRLAPGLREQSASAPTLLEGTALETMCGVCKCIGNSVTTAASNCMEGFWSWTTMDLSHFATDYERRDLVSIGASVGFAASFGAPIGGLLFILDDVSSYLSKDIFFRTLVANAVGTFCLALHHGSLSNYSVIDLGAFLENASFPGYNRGTGKAVGDDDESSYNDDMFSERFAEVPLYLLVGAVGGLMGGGFCLAVNTLHQFRKRHTNSMSEQKMFYLQILEVIALSIITSALLFYLPAFVTNTCKEIGEINAGAKQAHTKEPDMAHLFFCKKGEINEIATLLLGSRSDAIKRLLTNPSSFESENLLAVGILFYVLMTLTFGVTLPSGIFSPTVITGASLGGVAGIKFQEHFNENVSPSTFALLGVASLLAGIQRSTVSLCIILVEGTGKVELLIPVIITVVTARYFAQLVHPEGIFQLVMAWNQFPFLSVEEMPRFDAFQVKKIIQDPAITLRPAEKAHRLVKLLQESNHNGFPIVSACGKLLGLVRRDQIVALIEFGVFDDDSAEGEAVEDPPARPSSLVARGSSSSDLPDDAMMHLAYHIKDDRYEFVENKSDKEKKQSSDAEGEDMIWHRETRQSSDQSVPPANEMSALLSTKKRSIKRKNKPSAKHKQSTSKSNDNKDSDDDKPRKCAHVSQNDTCNLYITWLDDKYSEKSVNLAAVMNQGVYCVTEFCPISKARTLFTGLGLRHVVVMGGPSGGDVVGVLTRASFLDDFIRQKTGA